MIGFFAVAGLLLVGALFFVVPPLLGRGIRLGEVSHRATNLSIYKDQLKELENDLANQTLDRDQYETAKLEIERRVIDEVEGDQEQEFRGGDPHWTLAAAVAIAIPLLVIPFYLTVGAPQALDAEKVAAQQQSGAHDLSPERIAQMVDQVKARLKSNPDDIDAWVMLAKTSLAIGRYDESVLAFRELIRRVPPDAQLMADFADTLAIANGRSLEGEPQKLIEQALALDPMNVKALALAGTIAYQKKDFSKAASLWRRILESTPPESEFAEQIRGSIAEAEVLAGAKPGGAALEKSAKVVTGNASISGKVEIDSALGKSVSAGDTVFVFARAKSGPKMPLAIQRITAKDLPFDFELTEAMAMAPGMSIGKFPELVIGARVSKSGNATPQAGDFESETIPVKVGAKGVRLLISRVVR